MSLIFLVFLTSCAVTAGWWIKAQRKKQIKEKKILVKIAEGDYDPEVMKHFRDAKKQRRKKPKTSSYRGVAAVAVMPLVPTGAMLSNWLLETARLVDILLPAIADYKVAACNCDDVLGKLKKTEDQLGAVRVSTSPQTEGDLRNWLFSIQAAYLEAHELTRQAGRLEREKRPLLGAANRAMTNFMSNYSLLDHWDLYKAPEQFHEMVELATRLKEEHKFHYSVPQGEYSFSIAANSYDQRETNNNGQIALSAMARLYETLPSLSRLLLSANVALTDSGLLLKARTPIKLSKPSKPSSAHVNALVETALDWAANYRNIEQTKLCSILKVKQDLAVFKANCADLNELLREVNTCNLPIEHIPLRRTFQKVVSLFDDVVAWESKHDWSHSAVECCEDAISTERAKVQEFTEAAASLRSLVSKLANCLAQEETAKMSYESATDSIVETLQFNAPTFNQSSVVALVNAHTRMLEIVAKNEERAALHNARVEHLRQQWMERRTTAQQALRKLLDSANKLRAKHGTCLEASACEELDRMLKVTELMGKCFG